MSEATIIVVDEEEELRENLKDYLEFLGYTVLAFKNGEEFLDKIDSLSADLVLMDYLLPGLDGIEVIRLTKEKKPNMICALVTASSQPSIVERAEQAGVNKLILKPYSQTYIKQYLEEALK